MRHGRHQSHLIGSSIYRCRILNNTPIHPRRLQKAKRRDVENCRWRSYLATCFLNDTKEKGNERKVGGNMLTGMRTFYWGDKNVLELVVKVAQLC